MQLFSNKQSGGKPSSESQIMDVSQQIGSSVLEQMIKDAVFSSGSTGATGGAGGVSSIAPGAPVPSGFEAVGSAVDGGTLIQPSTAGTGGFSLAQAGGAAAGVAGLINAIDEGQHIGESKKGTVKGGATAAGTAIGFALGGPLGAGIGSLVGDLLGDNLFKLMGGEDRYHTARKALQKGLLQGGFKGVRGSDLNFEKHLEAKDGVPISDLESEAISLANPIGYFLGSQTGGEATPELKTGGTTLLAGAIVNGAQSNQDLVNNTLSFLESRGIKAKDVRNTLKADTSISDEDRRVFALQMTKLTGNSFEDELGAITPKPKGGKNAR